MVLKEKSQLLLQMNTLIDVFVCSFERLKYHIIIRKLLKNNYSKYIVHILAWNDKSQAVTTAFLLWLLFKKNTFLNKGQTDQSRCVFLFLRRDRYRLETRLNNVKVLITARYKFAWPVQVSLCLVPSILLPPVHAYYGRGDRRPTRELW